MPKAVLNRLLALSLLSSLCIPAAATNLDVSASYRMRAASYSNLLLDLDHRNNHQYIGNDARFGLAVRKIELETVRGEEATMDVGLLFRALGVAGSTATLSQPLVQAANFYPGVGMTPFIENAYVRVHNLFGYPITATLGRQTFKLGSGLLLDDDGAGLTGAVIEGNLPWGGMKLLGFIFNDRNTHFGPPNSLDLAGFSLDLPTEGTWQFNELIERDRSPGQVFGCDPFNQVPNVSVNAPINCAISKALRSFTSARYLISYGPMVFDGEAAIERGAATPTSPGPSFLAPSPTHIQFKGDAEVGRAKWKQHIPGISGEGIGRISIGRASGNHFATGAKSTDEAFFPSHGHRFDGLERTGFGDFFAATPYEAFGGNYSTTTINGLHQGTSGIIAVGGGITPPAFHGITLDIDFFVFQADRVQRGSKSLGNEWDFRLRYPIQDHFSISASAAIFTPGTATNPAKGAAKKFTLEAVGRF